MAVHLLPRQNTDTLSIPSVPGMAAEEGKSRFLAKNAIDRIDKIFKIDRIKSKEVEHLVNPENLVNPVYCISPHPPVSTRVIFLLKKQEIDG